MTSVWKSTGGSTDVEDQRLLLRIGDVCERLALGRSLVYRLIQRGAIRSVKVAGARRVLSADLEEFVRTLRGGDDEAVGQ